MQFYNYIDTLVAFIIPFVIIITSNAFTITAMMNQGISQDTQRVVSNDVSSLHESLLDRSEFHYRYMD